MFGIIIQELSFDTIEAMHQIDANTQLDMLITIDQDKPYLVVTHIHQGSQADEMEWFIGELIATINDKEIYTLDELKAILASCKNSAVLLECRNGRIGYFRVE